MSGDIGRVGEELGFGERQTIIRIVCMGKKFYFNKNKKEDSETNDLAYQVKALGTKADDLSLVPRSYNVEENRFFPAICFLTHGACTHAHTHTQ